MSGYDRVFPPRLIEEIATLVESRLIRAGDYANRGQPILPHYKVAPTDELVTAVIGSIHGLTDEAKREMIAALERTMSKGNKDDA